MRLLHLLLWVAQVMLMAQMFDGCSPPCYKIQGELYHQISAIAPDDGHTPLYSQLYICDNLDALHR